MLTTREITDGLAGVAHILMGMNERIEELEKKCGIGEVIPKVD